MSATSSDIATRAAFACILALAAACAKPDTPEPRPRAAAELAAAPEPATPEPAAEPNGASSPAPQVFGAAIDPAIPEVALSRLLASPAEHAGKTIRTHGTIERVCQRMGCWMEIRAEGKPSAVRVPMAGHAFFLPQSVAGKRCTVQGTVRVEALSEAHKRHLQEEGARATDVDLSIVATGVAVHP